MSHLVPQTLLADMLKAADGVLHEKQPEVHLCAEGAFRGVVEIICAIQNLYEQGEISPEQARMLLRIRCHTSVAVLKAVKGLSPQIVADAVDGALAAIRTPVNDALGWSLI